MKRHNIYSEPYASYPQDVPAWKAWLLVPGIIALVILSGWQF